LQALSSGPVTVSPRRLILVYLALEVLLDIVVRLPGGPSFPSDTSFIGWLAFDAVLVWLLWRRSAFAWIVLSVTTVMNIPLILLGTADLASVVFAVGSLAQLAVLVAPPVLTFVWSRRQAPLKSA
jgi:hypothetical protein